MCLFCKIAAREVPAKILFEDDDLVISRATTVTVGTTKSTQGGSPTAASST